MAGVGKRYVKYEDVPTLVSRAVRLGRRQRRSQLWAVRHIDLQVERGDTLGIIGRNGSGKTTTLRMLAGVTAPTEGVVSVRGRVAPLISVGVGFHPELTGRENVYVNGAVLGLARREIDALYDHIVDFAELEEFIDTPVKFYSSGMFVRLGFSVAVASRPDILLVDEVLAVGDLSYQLKCVGRMNELKAEGASIVVVSHNLNVVRHLCSRVLVLDGGAPRFLGATNEAISEYHRILDAPRRRENAAAEPVDAPVRVSGFELLGPRGRATAHVHAGEEITFRIHARFDRSVENTTFGFALSNESGTQIYADSTRLSQMRPFAAGEETRCDVRFRAALTTGTYVAHAVVRWGDGVDEATHSDLMTFFVSGRPLVYGLADLTASFRLDGEGVRRSNARARRGSKSRRGGAER